MALASKLDATLTWFCTVFLSGQRRQGPRRSIRVVSRPEMPSTVRRAAPSARDSVRHKTQAAQRKLAVTDTKRVSLRRPAVQGKQPSPRQPFQTSIAGEARPHAPLQWQAAPEHETEVPRRREDRTLASIGHAPLIHPCPDRDASDVLSSSLWAAAVQRAEEEEGREFFDRPTAGIRYWDSQAAAYCV